MALSSRTSFLHVNTNPLHGSYVRRNTLAEAIVKFKCSARGMTDEKQRANWAKSKGRGARCEQWRVGKGAPDYNDTFSKNIGSDWEA